MTKTRILIVIAAIAVIAIAVVAAVKTKTLEISVRVRLPFWGEQYQAIGTDDDRLLAIVNGEEIYRGEYKDRLSRAIQQYRYQGANIMGLNTIQLIKEEVVRGIVNDKLLLQYAQKAGIVVGDDKVAEVYKQDIERSGGEENLVKTLESVYLTPDKYREIVRERLIIDEYLKRSVDLSSATSTPEEVRSAYDQAVKGLEKAPTFEEAAEPVRRQLIQIKSQRIINNYLNELIRKSAIDLFL